MQKMRHENHIINKQVFEFSCSRYEDAFQLQKQMESGLQHTIQACISTVLDEWNNNRETIRIDQLEINIGEIAFENFSAVLPGKIYACLAEQLDTVTVSRKSSIENIPENTGGDAIELLELFFLSGSLPWWAGAAKEFSLTEVLQQLIESNSVNLKILILKYVLNEKFAERIVQQTDAGSLEKLIDLLPGMPSLRLVIVNVVKQLLLHVDRSTDLTTTFHSVTGDTKIRQDFSKSIALLLFKIIAIRPMPVNAEQLTIFIKEKINEVFGKTVNVNLFEECINPQFEKEAYCLIKTASNDIGQIGSTTTFSFNECTLEASCEKIYIQNAGLVLIAAFLPALFKELQWADDGVFRNREMQLKALFLLHYMATGIDEAPEYTLQLNKVLCGFKLDEPIPFSVELSAYEKQEADQLLQDIIAHWTALKSSNTEALRGSFLLRDGLLSYKNGRWLLQVERIGYDVLLNHIPWSWATVKCGWMETHIETEW